MNMFIIHLINLQVMKFQMQSTLMAWNPGGPMYLQVIYFRNHILQLTIQFPNPSESKEKLKRRNVVGTLLPEKMVKEAAQEKPLTPKILLMSTELWLLPD